MELFQLTILLTFGLLALYILSCLFIGGVKKVNIKLAAYYTVVMSLMGVLGELIVDSIYKLAVGSPLWVYKVLPVHGGFTSSYSIFIWGAMGFQLYLLHDTLSLKEMPSLNKLVFIFALEAVALEALFDLLSLTLFKRYVYYYLPNNLWHITSFQVMPLYLITGYFYVFILTRFKPRKQIA